MTPPNSHDFSEIPNILDSLRESLDRLTAEVKLIRESLTPTQEEAAGLRNGLNREHGRE